MLLQSCLLIGSSFLLLCYFGTAEGFIVQMISECRFSTLQDMQYLFMFTFNKQPFLYYDPNEGKFISLMIYGNDLAKHFNNDKKLLQELKEDINVTCRNNMTEYWSQTVDRKARPSVAINTIVPKTSGFTTALVCHVGGFYPPDITVIWLKNGNEVNQSVYRTAVLPNGDWTYQIRTSVEFTPRMNDRYTCLVNHASLSSPLAENWKPGFHNYERYYSIVATAVFVVGLLALFLGLIYWKSASYGFGYIPIMGNTDE